VDEKSYIMTEILCRLFNGAVSILLSTWLTSFLFHEPLIVTDIFQIIIFLIVYGLNSAISGHHSVTLLANALLTYKHSRKSQLEAQN